MTAPIMLRGGGTIDLVPLPAGNDPYVAGLALTISESERVLVALTMDDLDGLILDGQALRYNILEGDQA